MDTATKTGMDAAKIDSERVVQKTAEATGDLKLFQQVNQKKDQKENLQRSTFHQKKDYKLLTI